MSTISQIDRAGRPAGVVRIAATLAALLMALTMFTAPSASAHNASKIKQVSSGSAQGCEIRGRTVHSSGSKYHIAETESIIQTSGDGTSLGCDVKAVAVWWYYNSSGSKSYRSCSDWGWRLAQSSRCGSSASDGRYSTHFARRPSRTSWQKIFRTH